MSKQAKTATAAADITAAAPKFTKTQLLESKQFKPLEKDVLNAFLADGANYTLDEAKKIISDFTHRKVK